MNKIIKFFTKYEGYWIGVLLVLPILLLLSEDPLRMLRNQIIIHLFAYTILYCSLYYLTRRARLRQELHKTYKDTQRYSGVIQPLKGYPEAIEMYRLWIPCQQGEGNAIRQDGKNMKMVAMIVNGSVIYLEKDFYIEKQYLSKEEVDNLTKN